MIFETYICCLANGLIEYGFTFKAEPGIEDTLFDIVLGAIESKAPDLDNVLEKAWTDNEKYALAICPRAPDADANSAPSPTVAGAPTHDHAAMALDPTQIVRNGALGAVFYQECFNACESFTELGAPLLATLLYLQGAILKSTYIEVRANDPVLAFVAALDGANVWLEYISVTDADADAE